jgi:hypothetical protein
MEDAPGSDRLYSTCLSAYLCSAGTCVQGPHADGEAANRHTYTHTDTRTYDGAAGMR